MPRPPWRNIQLAPIGSNSPGGRVKGTHWDVAAHSLCLGSLCDLGAVSWYPRFSHLRMARPVSLVAGKDSGT